MSEKEKVQDVSLPEPSDYIPSYRGIWRRLGLRDLFLGKQTKPARFRKAKNRNVFWQDFIRVLTGCGAVFIFQENFGLTALGVLVIIAFTLTVLLRRYLP